MVLLNKGEIETAKNIGKMPEQKVKRRRELLEEAINKNNLIIERSEQIKAVLRSIRRRIRKGLPREQLVREVKAASSRILEMLDEIDKADKAVIKAEKQLGIGKGVPGRIVVHLVFQDLREILDREQKIKKRIEGDVNTKKKIVEEIKSDLKVFSRMKDVAEIWKEANKELVQKILQYPGNLLHLNTELIDFFKAEFRFERKEHEILVGLGQALKRDEKKFGDVKRIFGGLNIPNDLISRYGYFGTNLDAKEEEIVVHTIGHTLIDLYRLYGNFRDLIIKENEKINEFLRIAREIEAIQRPGSREKLDIKLIDRFKKIEEVIVFIENQEFSLAEKIFKLEDRIKEAYKALQKLEGEIETRKRSFLGHIKERLAA